jgi:hypothetical protein
MRSKCGRNMPLPPSGSKDVILFPGSSPNLTNGASMVGKSKGYVVESRPCPDMGAGRTDTTFKFRDIYAFLERENS